MQISNHKLNQFLNTSEYKRYASVEPRKEEKLIVTSETFRNRITSKFLQVSDSNTNTMFSIDRTILGSSKDNSLDGDNIMMPNDTIKSRNEKEEADIVSMH
jgi:hypothetical protein